jgi:hypothetical protein
LSVDRQLSALNRPAWMGDTASACYMPQTRRCEMGGRASEDAAAEVPEGGTSGQPHQHESLPSFGPLSRIIRRGSFGAAGPEFGAGVGPDTADGRAVVGPFVSLSDRSVRRRSESRGRRRIGPSGCSGRLLVLRHRRQERRDTDARCAIDYLLAGLGYCPAWSWLASTANASRPCRRESSRSSNRGRTSGDADVGGRWRRR